MTRGRRAAALGALASRRWRAPAPQPRAPRRSKRRALAAGRPRLGGGGRRPHLVHQGPGLRSVLDQRRVVQFSLTGSRVSPGGWTCPSWAASGSTSAAPAPPRAARPQPDAHPRLGAGRGSVPAGVAPLPLRAPRPRPAARLGAHRRRLVPRGLRADGSFDAFSLDVSGGGAFCLGDIGRPTSEPGWSPTAATAGSPRSPWCSPRPWAPDQTRRGRSTSARWPRAADSSGSPWL